MCAVSPRERLNCKPIQQGPKYTEKPVSFRRGPVFYYLMYVGDNAKFSKNMGTTISCMTVEY